MVVVSLRGKARIRLENMHTHSTTGAIGFMLGALQPTHTHTQTRPHPVPVGLVSEIRSYSPETKITISTNPGAACWW